MTSKQFCSVCKQWLDMEVVPTGDGDDDDGVVWFRCPRCQGFLPKLSSTLAEELASGAPADQEADADSGGSDAAAAPDPGGEPGTDMPWDSPADMLAAQVPVAGEDAAPAADPDLVGDLPDLDEAAAVLPFAETEVKDKEPESTAPASEPIAEYAALLAEQDVAAAIPYRPWESYEVGQCVHHLAWSDCGVVVAKESLPGGRHVIKCYFGEAGIVRLIEKADR